MRNFRERLLKSLPLEVGVPYRSAVWGISNVLFLQFRFAGEPCCEGFGWLGDAGMSAVWGIFNVLFHQFRFAGEPCCEGGFGWLGDGGIIAANNGLSE